MIIVFGGSFNPVTIAHILVYEKINEIFKPEKFIFLPVSNKYSKSNLIDNEYRYNMLKIATKGHENIEISDLEFKDEVYKGTYNSLNSLKTLGEDIYFLMGSDNFLGIKSWINYQKLIEEYKLIIINRNSYDIMKFIEEDDLLNKYKNNFIFVEDFDIKISSSLFRKTKDSSLVNKEVYDYIMKEKLY